MERLAFNRTGVGEPLILLHPLGADRHVWSPVLELLAPHRDVLAVDLPGFGSSPPLAADQEAHPRRLAAEVSALLSDLGLAGGRAHVAGCSLGGWVALEMAARGDAASVTAIAPAGLWAQSLGDKPELARRIARLVGPVLGPAMRIDSVRRLALGRTVAHPERVPSEEAAALVRAYAAGRGFTAANRAMRAGRFEALDSIAVPVTLAWPEHDRLVARPRSTSPKIRQLDLEDCGHIPMWDDPRAVADALLCGSSRG
jgi:pimeloyl-ACP methyl ester carboxylesterase